MVRRLLLLSHGQATVERGFSVNKEASVENLSEKAMVAKRQIINHVRHVGGVTNVKLSGELLGAAGSARKQYHDYLDEQREEERQRKSGEKRKAQEGVVADLVSKRRRLEREATDLEKEGDKLALDGENKQQWFLISKSNAMRAKAKAKREEVTTLDGQIEEESEKLKDL